MHTVNHLKQIDEPLAHVMSVAYFTLHVNIRHGNLHMVDWEDLQRYQVSL